MNDEERKEQHTLKHAIIRNRAHDVPYDKKATARRLFELNEGLELLTIWLDEDPRPYLRGYKPYELSRDGIKDRRK